ncbi:CpsB/CapC family capsule biosynthesis tyrosine phosphatase [Sporomusa sp.]|uniref:CpsB/CapC family capsule biosynthesis tyrosine phosphatase n=1 Tax=Sporomusa sp. TaxID=2078658 RepID=UPI002CD9E899|nr:CpsB/CapC family capsule biosynthesis tyrosine phosphatase [Sporomusa sp.]HWR45816.1 CpsB/CapC family capsule biosynthesis tyrosine phosphatase [Sporomusa sp.]
MLDLHCHIILAIDDGAKDLDTSLKMLEIAQKNGTKAIVATPHVIEGQWLPSWDRCQRGRFVRHAGAHHIVGGNPTEKDLANHS